MNKVQVSYNFQSLNNVNNSSIVYENLLHLCADDSNKLRITMLSLLKRTILSYLTFHSYFADQSYREGQYCLEQTDLAFFQIQAFIFQEEGINNLVEEYQNISTVLRQPNDVKHIICKICQSDFELISCLGGSYGEEFNNQFEKGLKKLFSTIFFAQNYYATKDLRQILQNLNCNDNYESETIILTACELNAYNGSLYLKKNLLPPHYEPIYAEQIKRLKESIVDKLRTQNDSFSELFGNSLAYELSQWNNPESTLTIIRSEILKAIVKDQKQVLLQDFVIILRLRFPFNLPTKCNHSNFYAKVRTQHGGKVLLENRALVCSIRRQVSYWELETKDNIQKYVKNGEKNEIKNTLEQNAIYLNLLFLVNKYIGQNLFICIGLPQIKEICIQMKPIYQNKIFDNFILLLNESSMEEENQQITDSAYKQQIKKQQLLQRFNKMSQVFQEQSQIQQKQETICVKCRLPINEFEIQYKPVLLDYTNQHKYYCQANIQKDLELDLLQVNTTCCGHLYHYQCIRKIRSKHKQGQKIYQCCICFASFNFYFMNPLSIKNFQNTDFIKSMQKVFDLIPKEKLQYYYQKYAKNNELKMSLVITELFSCSLFSLLLQLLSDINQFYERKNHIFLQEIIILLKLAYSENFVTILDLYPINNDELLYKLFRVLINNASFKYSENEFQQELQLTLQDTQNMLPIIDLITKSELKQEVLYEMPYDIRRFKQELKNKFIQLFEDNFAKFLIKFNLVPCAKKKCKSFPFYQSGFQCICLICLKKMCSKNCGHIQEVQIGNLSRHSQKKHMSKSLFLNINNSKIYVMQEPLIVICNLTLFQNLTGEQPWHDPYQQQHYMSFKLNFKAVEWIVDVLIGYKYLNKIFADTTQTLISIL